MRLSLLQRLLLLGPALFTPGTASPESPGPMPSPPALEGRQIRVRYLWSRVHSGRPRWEQAFSSDGGSWETNWVMDFTRAGEER